MFAVCWDRSLVVLVARQPVHRDLVLMAYRGESIKTKIPQEEEAQIVLVGLRIFIYSSVISSICLLLFCCKNPLATQPSTNMLLVCICRIRFSSASSPF